MPEANPKESERNIDVVRRLTQEGFVGGNLGVVDELVAKNCVDHDPMPGGAQGAAGMKATCQMVVEGLSNRRTLSDECLAVGDKVVENWIFEGTHTGSFMGIPPTGKVVHVRGMEIWRLDDGQIVEHWGVIDTGAVLEQIGPAPR